MEFLHKYLLIVLTPSISGMDMSTLGLLVPILTKDLNRADKKRLQKLRKEMMKRGEDTYEIDIQLGVDE